ncbi:MAG: DMT family transporter [Alphaproteobacteria bacterium]|nr:DMT family transporter [Alphaproteobacteria bacterium]
MNDKTPEQPAAAPAVPPVVQPALARRRGDNVPAGIACLVASTTLFSVVNMAAKWLSETYPLGEIVFFRSALSLIPCAAIVATHGGLLALRSSRVGMHGMRTFFGFISLTAAFLSFSLMPLGDAVALGYAGPLFVTALSVPLLAERVGAHRWSAVGVGFLGVLLMAHPSGSVTMVGALAGLANAFFYALSMISVRQLGATETAPAMLFYHSMFSTAFALPLLWFGWVTPSLPGLAALCGIGLLGGGSQWLVIHAFRQAPPSSLSPFAYIGLVWAMAWSWLIWGDLPTAWLLGGAGLVVASGLYILRREIMLGLIKRRAADDMT